MADPSGPDSPAFGPADKTLLSLLTAQNAVLRSGLCTLARIGVAFRKREPDRARAWADTLSRHPLYKAGQFLFDLMEWEDFMLDGEPPPLAMDLAHRIVVEVAHWLNLGQGIEIETPPPDTPLPALESGFYLYRDVVLGLVDGGLTKKGAGGRFT